MDDRRRVPVPTRWRAYAAWSAVSSLLVLLELHRVLFRVLRALSVPELTISALLGVANASWYDLAYLVGGGLKSAAVFTGVPLVGVAAGVTSAVALWGRLPWCRRAAAAHLGFGLVVAALALAVLGWRFARDFRDPWRLVTTVAFLLTHLAWIVYLGRARTDVAPGAAPS